MGFTINIDIGGTFTDFFAENDEGAQVTKTPSTHYDLSVGFMKGIKDLSRKFGVGMKAFLGNTDMVRYCTTVGTNALIERTGPNKRGLFLSSGVHQRPNSTHNSLDQA